MLKKFLFLFFNNENDHPVADVLTQTISVLKKNGHDIIYLDLYHSRTFRECLRNLFLGDKRQFGLVDRKGALYFIPLLIPFISRWYIGYIISIAVNIFFLHLYLSLFYPHLQKNIWVHYLFPPFFISFFPHSYTVLYDVFDYITFSDELTAKIIKEQRQYLLSRADFICCISHALKKRMKLYTTKPITIVPQGFSAPQFLSKNCPDELKTLRSMKKPLIGFSGGISERLDEYLLFSLIKNNPQWQFVLLGPIIHEPYIMKKDMDRILSRLLTFSNVNHISRVTREKSYQIIKEFDIAMIPYDISQDFNRYCYPMKLFEYFYMGKPVISTPIEELKRFSKYVRIGRTAEEWEKHIQSLLAKPWSKAYQEKQRKLAITNSWEKKIDRIFQLILYTQKNSKTDEIKKAEKNLIVP